MPLDVGDRNWLRRLIIGAAIVLPVVYALVVNARALDNPPAWDSAFTVSPAALTMVDLDFDIWALAQLPSSPEGGPSTHATSIYTIGLALLILVFGPTTGFYVAHLISIALVGALAAATYLLARERASVSVSALAAITVAIMPVVIQQGADLYLDLPLAVLTTLACWSAIRRRFWLTTCLVLVAIATKSSGVFLLPLLLLARPEAKSLRRHYIHTAFAGLIAIVPFLLVLATTHRLDTTVTPLMTRVLIRSSALLLPLTIDVFVLVAIYVLVTYGRVRSESLDRTTQASLIIFVGFYVIHVATMVLSGTITILPRYYIAILPVLVAALLPVESREEAGRSPVRALPVALIGILAVFSLINVRGDFYPRADDDFYILAERSTRAQDLLDLQVLGSRRLVATGLPVVVERTVYFRLAYPGLGYVDASPEQMRAVFLDPLDRLPDEFVMLIERRFANRLILIEEEALEQGYHLSYETLSVGPFQSQLIVASKS